MKDYDALSKTFENAKFYDLEGEEYFSHTEAGFVLYQYIENLEQPPTESITVVGVSPMEVDKEWCLLQITKSSDGFAEVVMEMMYDNYGDPDWEHFDGLEDEIRAKMSTIVEEVAKLCSKQVAWQCDQWGKKTYSVEELLEFAKECNIEWEALKDV